MPATKGLLFRRYIGIELNMWRHTLFEAVALIIMVLVILLNPIAHSKRLLYKRTGTEKGKSIESHTLTDLSILQSVTDSRREKTRLNLGYTPNTPFVSQLAGKVMMTLELNDTIPFESEDELENQLDERTTLAGLVFRGDDLNDVPNKLNMLIRFPSEFRTVKSYQTEDRLWITRCSGLINSDREQVDKNIKQDIYIREGFLQLQHQVFLEWYHRLLEKFNSEYSEPNVLMYNILLKAADEPCVAMSLARLPTFLYYFIYLLPFLNIIRNVASQVQDGVMVHQWYYGYSFGTQWAIKFCVLFFRLIILGAIFILIIVCFWVFGDDNKQLSGFAILAFVCFVVLFTVELIITALVVAKLFGNPTNAVLFALGVWLFTYAAFAIVLERYWDTHKYYVFFILVSFFNCQMLFAMDLFRYSHENPDFIRTNDFVVLFVSVIGSGLIYYFLLLALQWRIPGRYLSRRVVNNRARKAKDSDKVMMHMSKVPSISNFEFGDAGIIELMRLRHISTTHRDSERKILKNISLRIYQGEVYVILGHIGSGKLTLLRVMAGLKYPIRGTVLLTDKPFLNTGGQRHLVDFRFAEHGLNEKLTVEQTIDFHVRLKLTANDSDRYQIEKRKWLAILDPLIESRNTKIGKLNSGAMQMVALCCCLAGDTKIIIMEEPTERLSDREAQVFWSIVNSEKENRAFIFATHNFGDAEHVADRIGILSMGVLEASGTPFFLRAKFNSSVELVIIKKPHVPDVPITEFINKFQPFVEPENEIGDTLTYRLPSEFRPRLQKLLIHLESDRKKLGIENFKVVGAELSDIYMQLVTSYRLQQQIIPDVTQTFKYQVVSKKQLKRQRIRAMFYKRMINSAPNVWPVIMIIATFVLIAMIARITVLIGTGKSRANSIRIGFQDPSVISSIPDVKGCGYIDIKSTTTYSTASEEENRVAVARIFTTNSFTCEKGSYRDDLIRMHELKSKGAVELLEDGSQINGFITTDIFHSAPMVLNLVHNIILKLTYPGRTDLATMVTNHPMPTRISKKINLLDNKIAHIHVPLAIGCIIPMTVSVFVISMMEEKIYNFRFMEHLAGMSLSVYWTINLFWDWFNFLIYSIIIVLIMAVFGIGGFGMFENLIIVMLLAFFGLAAIPITYLVTMFVNSSILRAYLVSMILQGMSGFVLYIIYWDVANSNSLFYHSACMSPGFSLLDGISNIYTQSVEHRLCRAKCLNYRGCTPKNMHEIVPNCKFDTYFKWSSPGILPAIVCMSVCAIIALVLIFWIELQRRERKFHSSRDLHKMRTATYPFDDGDVADVKQKIAEADNTKAKQSVFLVDQVEAKIPQTGNRIHTISFALNKYMSMGIYGPRHAGKSHLIQQLVGEKGFAYGEIYVRGLDFKYDLESIHTYMGYNPQYRGLLPNLTPREHIRLLCMIRGVPQRKISEKIHDLCLMLNMTGWMHRRCGLLTAEKLAKLKVALALVAYNKILVLDEPTAGMPATTRREIWNILRYMRYCGKTMIFATNDELECKILADFIILFIHGEMLAIGSLQYLRYKYSHGFYFEVRLIRDGATIAETEENLRKDVDNLAKFVNFMHNRSELVARRRNWLKYYVPVDQIVYSYLYGSIEKNRVRLNIQDYCIYQAHMRNVVAHVHDTRTELKNQMVVQTNDF
ncbi:ABC transporter A family member 1 [Drosophila serrata]|uniref:ABC transporter A family member 1 n=1 Tax=Drosophila serrata TaxID=7274 RepID=UPI000A1D392E|nr:ABC transporter A family member 1 [Drosophila serrata]KAH8390010.1 hypothetical protein KR200_005550 [Drosophila serrata]